ncbi:unnamed protein product [Haemonchus placei]|uniref:DM5 domain-containing protein n=1 Tax=Haemonchus placei TaxID=6290 RepID=A0A0N4W0S9_HAEPC|nr:unnamed protein product [Haemonchus placei]
MKSLLCVRYFILLVFARFSQQLPNPGDYDIANSAKLYQAGARSSPTNSLVDYAGGGSGKPSSNQRPGEYQVKPMPSGVAPIGSQNAQSMKSNNIRPFVFPKGTYLPNLSERKDMIGSAQGGPKIAAVLMIPNHDPSGGIGSRMVGQPIEKGTLAQLTSGGGSIDSSDDDSIAPIYIIEFKDSTNSVASPQAPFRIRKGTPAREN